MQRCTAIGFWLVLVILLTDIGLAIATDYSTWCDCEKKDCGRIVSCDETYDSIIDEKTRTIQEQSSAIISGESEYRIYKFTFLPYEPANESCQLNITNINLLQTDNSFQTVSIRD